MKADSFYGSRLQGRNPIMLASCSWTSSLHSWEREIAAVEATQSWSFVKAAALSKTLMAIASAYQRPTLAKHVACVTCGNSLHLHNDPARRALLLTAFCRWYKLRNRV